jgi:hypothetical protein
MEVVTVLIKDLPEWAHEHVRAGYAWGCGCGEAHMTQESAESCRKCRKYLSEVPTQVYFTPMEAHVEPEIIIPAFYADADYKG